MKLWKGFKPLSLLLCILSVLSFCACATVSPSIEATPSLTPSPTLAPLPTPDETPVAPPVPSPSPGSVGGEEEYPLSALTGVATPDDNLPSLDSYRDAKALNPEVIGWITIPGTDIDYPVVQGKDNNYYLGRNVENEKSRYGAIFMDYRNADPDQQKHIIVYGHNMKNGTMFHQLMNYKQRDFFNNNRTINLLWGDMNTVWEIYLAYLVMPDEVYHIHTLFADNENFANVMMDTVAYAKTVKPANMADNIKILPSDQVLTLSTCTYEYDGTFFAVMAKRIS